MSLLFPFITSLFITMALIVPLMKLAPRLGIIDIPDPRKVHTGQIPRIGGIAMASGVLISVLLWCKFDLMVGTYLIGAAIILFFGAWDDRSNLDYKLKFFGQIVAVTVPVVFGDVMIRDLPFFMSGTELPAFIAAPFTIFFLLGVTNAINLSDGLDGLAGGTSLLALGLLAVLAYLAEDTNSFIILVGVGGSILGFLRYNTHPAQVFMGDCGSQFLGFSAGMLAIVVTQQSNAALSPALPLIVLGLPILDTLLVMARRIMQGRSPFSPDKKHLHHRLLELGITHYEAVFWIYVVQTTLICAAYLLRYESDILVLGFYLLFCCTVTLSLHLAESLGWKLQRNGEPAENRFLARKLKWLRDRNRLENFSFLAVSLVLAAYILTVLVYAQNISTDIGLLSLTLFFFLELVHILRRNRSEIQRWLERGVAYVTAAVLLYLTETAVVSAIVGHWLNALLVTMAVAIAVHTRYHKQGSLRLTTLDFLVIVVAVIMPFSPVATLGGINIGLSLAKLIVLFYATELILNRLVNAWLLPRAFLYLFLATVGLKALVVQAI